MAQVAVGQQIWHYEEIGRGKGAPLLILHGWGRSGSEWIAMAKELSLWSGRKAFVLDLPGFGGSSLPAQAGLPHVKTIEEYSELVAAFCEYMDLKQVVIIGHSLGGRVGIVLGAKHKEIVEKLVLIDPAGVKPRSVRRVALKTISKVFGWVPARWRRGLAASVMDEDYHNSPALRSLYRVIVGPDLRAYLPQIHCETTVVWGENDPTLPITLTAIYRQYLRQARVRVVWGAGHDPHLTHFDQTLRILQESVA